MGSGISNSRQRGTKDGKNAYQKKAAPGPGLPQRLVLSKLLSFLTQRSTNTKEIASEPVENHDQDAGRIRRARTGVS